MATADDPNDASPRRDRHLTPETIYSSTNVASSPSKPTSIVEQNSCVLIRSIQRYSLLRGLVHALSILIAAIVLTLCAKTVYFSDITQPNINSKLNYFQFVARLHEYTVCASLTGIMTYHLQNFLCSKDGLPLGYVACSFQALQLQSLCSKEFWAASTCGNNNTSARKYCFTGLLVLVMTVGALIGPSSAVLIVPQLEWWPLRDPFSGTNGFSWIDSSYESLWPASVNASSVPSSCNVTALETDRACPFINLRDIQNWVSDYKSQSSPANITITADSGILNYLTASDGDRRNGYSVAATGMSFLTRSLGTIWSYGQKEHFNFAKVGRPMITLTSADDDRPTLGPLVQTQCAPPLDITTGDYANVTFLTNLLKLRDGGNSTVRFSRNINATDYRSNDKHVRFRFIDLSADSQTTTLGGLFGASFNISSQAATTVNGTEMRALFACTVKTLWIPMTIFRAPTIDNVVILDNPNPFKIVSNNKLMGRARDLTVNITFADSLNAPLYGHNYENVIESELSRFSDIPPFFTGSANESWSTSISTVLSMQLADALARISHTSNQYIWYQSTHNTSDFYAKSIRVLQEGVGGQDRMSNTSKSYPDQIRADRNSKFPLRLSFSRHGYAWGFSKRTPKIVASIVLLVHILLIFFHTAIVWQTKSRFTSRWESLGEFLILAMRSNVWIRDSSRLGIFGDPVYIKERENKSKSDKRESALLVMDGKALR